jgi:hypothetical protein
MKNGRHQDPASPVFRSRMRFAIAALILLGPLAPVRANFYAYQEWVALNRAEREIYLAGAFDSLTSFGTGADEVGISHHYETCVRNAKMDLSQLTQNVIRFARDKPELHTGSVQLALLRYLIAACGQPPVK